MLFALETADTQRHWSHYSPITMERTMKRVYFACTAILFCICLATLCEASTHAVIASRNSAIINTIRTGDLAVFETEDLFTNPLNYDDGLAFGVAITRNGYAYVTSPKEDAVYVLDPFLGQLVDTIDMEVGDTPLGIAASPNGRFVYITNFDGGNLRVIDTADPSNVLPTAIGLGYYPAGVAVSPDSRYVYVVNTYGSRQNYTGYGSLYALTASDGTVAWTVDNLGERPLAVAVSPDGHNVYVTNSGNGTLSVIDTVAKSEVTGLFSRIKVGTDPIGVTASPDGQFIYVANREDNTVSVIQTSEDVVDYEVITEIDVGVAPLGIAVTPDGAKVFVTNQGDDTAPEYGSVSIIYTYDYHVETVLESEKGPACFGKFIGSISAPEVPSDLEATAVSESEISLSWTDNSTDELEFSIGRRTQSNETYVEIAVVDANVNTYTDTELNEATPYGYKIRAYNNYGYSAVSSIAIATTYPAAPSNLALEASDGQVSLSWTDNSNGELGYRIERKTGLDGLYEETGTVDADITTYIDSDLGEATVYYYQIKAYNSSGDSSPCAEANITTCPAAPTDLAFQVLSDSQVNLSWTDNSQKESGYKIERKKVSDQIYEQIAVVGADVSTFSDSGLSEATTYYYQVRAYSDSCDANPSAESHVTTDPTAPSDLTATAISTSRVKLSWKDNSDFTMGYVVQRKLASDVANYETAVTINDPDVTTYTDSGLKESTAYTYKVWAFINELSASDLQDKSNHSSEVSVTTSLAAPSSLSATDSKGLALLNWKDHSDGETGFEIERKTLTKKSTGLASDNDSTADSGTFASIAKVGANVTTYTDNDVDSGTDYVYRVRTLDGSETSDYSNEAQLEWSSSTSCFIDTARAAHFWNMK